MRVLMVIGGLVVGALVLGAIINAFKDPTDCSSRDAKFYALVLLQEQVKRRLRAPASADFPAYEPRDSDNGVYTVISYVDTVNVFGGPVRRYFTGTVRCTPTHDSRSWRVLEFNLE